VGRDSAEAEASPVEDSVVAAAEVGNVNPLKISPDSL
jgi:hypothetical protein